MELKWLEDFVVLAEEKNFGKAAIRRNITQPAFSRRIQSLESWFGNPLIDRSSYPTKLTPAGVIFYESARELIDSTYRARDIEKSKYSSDNIVLDIAILNNLSLYLFPKWISYLNKYIPNVTYRAKVLSTHDIFLAMNEGSCDFLISYDHPSQSLQPEFETKSVLLGYDYMGLYSIRSDNNRVMYDIQSYQINNLKIPYLNYSSGTYFGRISQLLIEEHLQNARLNIVYEGDVSESIKHMLLEGLGIGFLPESSISEELLSGKVKKAHPNSSTQIGIKIYKSNFSGKNKIQSSKFENRNLMERKNDILNQIWALQENFACLFSGNAA